MEIKLYNCKAFDIHIDKLPNITFKVLQKKSRHKKGITSYVKRSAMQPKNLIFKKFLKDKIQLDRTDSINKAILNRKQANFKTYFRMHFA